MDELQRLTGTCGQTDECTAFFKALVFLSFSLAQLSLSWSGQRRTVTSVDGSCFAPKEEIRSGFVFLLHPSCIVHNVLSLPFSPRIRIDFFREKRMSGFTELWVDDSVALWMRVISNDR